ncbi:TauD/TfdA dioxygenase family protein [Sphingomonas sp. DT-204]|uniref:TauD/TfdA dioxygenase family protein n=1 Tax=Sphingomonas sp. DT-204 TaxID=3396166 RepID=UPI003F1CB23B
MTKMRLFAVATSFFAKGKLVHIATLRPGFAAEVREFDLSELTGSNGQRALGLMRDTLATNLVMRIRGLDLEPDQFIGIAGLFGRPISLRRAGPGGVHFPDHPEIKIVSNARDAAGVKLGDGDAAENGWHNDGSYLVDATALTFLYGRKAPNNPPRTLFLNLIEAYRRLPDDLKRGIADRSAIHYSEYNHDPGDADAIASLTALSDRKRIGRVRPLVIRHPLSGEPCLMPPRQVDCVICGLTEGESLELAGAIWDFLRGLDCTWGEAILPGDLLIWDNRFTLHMREAFAHDEERLLWHTTTGGAEYIPYAEAA